MNTDGSQSTRYSLLERARQREESAWVTLVDLYGPLVAYWCRNASLDTHGTADCVQEVFASVTRSMHTFRSDGNPGAFRRWLWKITRNQIIDCIRKRDHFLNPPGGSTAIAALHQVVDPLTVPEEEPTDADLLKSLHRRALQSIEHEFESRTWAMFLRSVVDGVGTATVAAEFSVTEATVRKTRSRVLRRLRTQLGDEYCSEN